jgi:DNA-binding NarL/FixJ family response regulator
MEQTMRKILIVDDHVIYREGLISLFRYSSDFQVVGGAGTVHEGLEKAFATQPDIILMDYSLPDGTGLDAARAVLAKLPDCKIVFLTINETDEILFSAIRAGAQGFLLKSISGTDLLASLRSLTSQEKAISRKLMSRVFDEFAHSTGAGVENGVMLARLSPREVDVLSELGTGATNDEIAARLFLSANTVKHHIGNVLDKLAVENRREAAVLANRLGLKSKLAAAIK